MRIPVVFLAVALASPALGEAAASEDCRPRFFDEVKAGLASARGAVGSSKDFPMGVSVTPESGQIQDIAVRVWSVYGCAVPKVDFDVEGDDIDIGALHGVVTVMQAVFLEAAFSEADMDDISPRKPGQACQILHEGSPANL